MDCINVEYERCSFYVEVKLKDGCSMSKSYKAYDYEKAKEDYMFFKKHEDTAYVSLVQCVYLLEEGVENGNDN